jgi:hypothetical protein
MKRWRVDFTVREADAPAEEARGVSFGEEVTTDELFGFFNRCRDSIVTLFTGRRPASDSVAEDPQEVAEKLDEVIKRELDRLKQRMAMGVPSRPPVPSFETEAQVPWRDKPKLSGSRWGT